MHAETAGPPPVKFLPDKMYAAAMAEHIGMRRLGFEVAEIQRAGKSLALIGRIRIEQAMPFRRVVEPGCVIYTIRSDGKGRSMMRARGGIPVLVAEPHRRHFAIQLDQRVVADIGVVDVAPCYDRVIIGIHGHGCTAAFTNMVGNFDVAPET